MASPELPATEAPARGGPSPHEVLGLRPGASPHEARAAFRRFARQHHPDRGGDPDTFRAGSEAYHRLVGSSHASLSADVVFHRRPRGLGVLVAAWHVRRRRRSRPARVN